MVQLHLSSVRHDLVSTWLFVSLVYFFHRWGKEKQLSALILSSLALGLVLGTNFSIAAFLPGFAVLALVGFRCYRYTFKQALGWVCAALLAFALLSSRFTSATRYTSAHGWSGRGGNDQRGCGSGDAARKVHCAHQRTLAYQLADLTWLPSPVEAYLTAAKAAAPARFPNRWV